MTRTVDDAEQVSRNRLYRNPSRGLLFGVCAGLADYFGFDLTATRVVTAVGTVFFWWIALAYVALGVLLPRKSHAYGRDPLAGAVRADPHEILAGARYRMREVEMRLQRLESYVTSRRFNLDREFRNLKG